MSFGRRRLLCPLSGHDGADELRDSSGRFLRRGIFAQTAFTPGDENPEDFPQGAGRDATFYACTPCHNFKLVAAQGLSRGQWDDSINLMTRRHNMPPLDAADRKVVLDYLEAAYPPRAPASRGGWQNPFSKQ